MTTQKRALRSTYQRMVVGVAPWKYYRGVPVYSSLLGDGHAERAVAKLAAAIELLHEFSPAHLSRVPRLMNGITISRWGQRGARWRKDLEIAEFHGEYVLDDATSPEDIASVLVHELTHARLLAAGISHKGPRRARCERLCALAERNFAHRLPASAARTALEARIESYLELPPEFFSDEAVEARSEQERAKWPLWLRAIHRVLFAMQVFRRPRAT